MPVTTVGLRTSAGRLVAIHLGKGTVGGEEFARTYLDIAEDTDFEALGVDAQWLYLRVLVPEPSLS